MGAFRVVMVRLGSLWPANPLVELATGPAVRETQKFYSLNSSRNLLVWARLTGISVFLGSSILSW